MLRPSLSIKNMTHSWRTKNTAGHKKSRTEQRKKQNSKPPAGVLCLASAALTLYGIKYGGLYDSMHRSASPATFSSGMTISARYTRNSTRCLYRLFGPEAEANTPSSATRRPRTLRRSAVLPTLTLTLTLSAVSPLPMPPPPLRTTGSHPLDPALARSDGVRCEEICTARASGSSGKALSPRYWYCIKPRNRGTTVRLCCCRSSGHCESTPHT